MRSIGLLAVTGVLVLAAACSDGAGTTPPENAAPVANFAVPACAIDVPCDFASTSTDDAAVTEWSWDFDGGGPDANTANAAFTYRTAGDFNVSLTVHDAEGLSHTKTSTITIAASVNAPPTAGFTHACTALDCTFTSTSSDVAPGTIATYAWTFGDGGTADVNTPSHTYSVTASTEFTVTLTVTDNEGATGVATQTITVAPVPSLNTPPTANFTHACTAVSCTFVSTSSDVAPGTIATYAWTFGDGGTAAVSNPLHSYTATATTVFTVTLTVTDNEGAAAVATKTITVDPAPPVNEAPTARFTPSCIAAVCKFVNTSFDHGGGRITAYAWTFGDGGTATDSTPTHTYAVTAATEFTVTLTVTNNEGASGVTSQKFILDPTAANIPPTASFSTSCYGNGCIFTSTSADAVPGTIVTYAWDFGDGATAVWNDWVFPKHLETHVYTVSASTQFTVRLTVTDNAGATAVATRTLTLSPLPPAVEGCTTSGPIVECVLDMTSRSTLKLKLLGVHCDIGRYEPSKISTPPPVGDQVFLSVCAGTVGQESGIFGGTLDQLWVYQAGSQARIQFSQGKPKSGTPPRGAPAGQVTGTFPDWTLSFDDGGNAGTPGEPNFTDLLVGVHATLR